MTNETTQSPGLNAFGDPSKLNFFNAPQQDQEEYQRALQASLSALEMRYAQPNWFKVAAGLAKPQLGGFMASLGSGAEALGENIEQQRANLLPISQLRAQLAMSKIGMGQAKDAAQAFTDWKKSGKPMDENTYTTISGLAPNSSVAAAAKAAFDAEKTSQSLRVSQQQLLNDQLGKRLILAKEMAGSGLITKDQYNQELADIKRLQTQLTPPAIPTGTTGNAEEPRAKDVGQGPAASDMTKAALNPAASAPPAAELPAQETPKTNKPDWSKFKLKPTMSSDQLINNPMTVQENKQNELTNKKAVALEAPHEAQFSRLTTMLDPTNFSIYKSAVKAIPAQFDADPEGTKNMVNLIRSKGVMAAVLDAGLKASFNGTSISAGLPVLQALIADMSPENQNKYDTFLKNLALSSSLGAQLLGYDPVKLGPERFAQVMAQEMNASNGIKAILHQNDVTQKHIDYSEDLLANVQEALQHPDLQKSLTPFKDAFTVYPGSIAAKKLFDKRLQKINNDYFQHKGEK